MSKYTRDQASMMAAYLQSAPGRADAAYWVEDDGTRDFLIDQLLKSMSEALAVLGKGITDDDYSDDDAAEDAGVQAILSARDEA